MREIKFRVWDKLDREMDYECPLNEVGHCCMGDEYSLNQLYFKNRRHIVMQYTGLKDSNGKEIYEGDIVLDNSEYFDLYETEGLFKDNKVICPLIVYWAEGDFGWALRNDKLEYADFSPGQRRLEVIGNIYDNIV